MCCSRQPNGCRPCGQQPSKACSRLYHRLPNGLFALLDHHSLRVAVPLLCRYIVFQRHLNHLCRMQRMAISELRYLLLATEARCYNHVVQRRRSHSRQQRVFTALY